MKYFWSLLMETLGFPTPYKKIVTVNLLGTEYSAIFEESIEKEFIERWGFRESPIISIDERQLMEKYSILVKLKDQSIMGHQF